MQELTRAKKELTRAKWNFLLQITIFRANLGSWKLAWLLSKTRRISQKKNQAGETESKKVIGVQSLLMNSQKFPIQSLKKGAN